MFHVEHSPILKEGEPMEIFVTNYGGDHKKIDKGISDSQWLSLGTGSLRNPSNVIDPVILTERNLIDFNYVSIPAFNRYYFVKEIRMVRDNLMEISLHVDVLYSFASGILQCTAIAHRTAKGTMQSPFIVDPKMPMSAQCTVQTMHMGNLGDSGLYILITAG